MIKFILIISILFSLTTSVMAKSPYTPDNQLTLPPNTLKGIDTITLKQELKELSIQMSELNDALCNSRDKRSAQYAQDYYERKTVQKQLFKVWKEIIMRRGKE